MARVNATHIDGDGTATGVILHLNGWEMEALAGLLNEQARDDGPLLDLLEALAPTWTAGQ